MLGFEQFSQTAAGARAGITMDWKHGVLAGEGVQHSRKTLADLRHLFVAGAAEAAAPETELYTVSWFGTEPGGTVGALLFGCTRLAAGTVGDEYFMTHGHFHADRTRDEMYFPVTGRGVLLRMDDAGRCWAEEMRPGGVLSISGAHAHRVVNTGDEPLVFWACWPADAGYDYATIAQEGFSLRVLRRGGRPALEQRA